MDTTMPNKAAQIEAIARAAHEVNRAYCLFHNDASQVSWDEAPENIRASCIDGVAVALSGAGPRAQHENWCRFKVADGWIYGETKDPNAKTHPCLVDYDSLPEHQRRKDALYLAIVAAMALAVAEKG